MSRYIPRRSAVPNHSIVSKGSSEALKVDIRDIERDLRLLASHQEILIVHANKELKNALQRVCSRASSLMGTSSHRSFYDSVQELFVYHTPPKIGSIGAFFRGYDCYSGDLSSRHLAPTVAGSLVPPGCPTTKRHVETSITLSRSVGLPSSIVVNNKGNSFAYIFTTDGSLTLLTNDEITMLEDEGISQYKIVHYVDGTYHSLTKDFVRMRPELTSLTVPIEQSVGRRSSRRNFTSAAGFGLFIFPPLFLIALIFFIGFRSWGR